MRALSIRQPWSTAILHAGKDVENRSRRTHYRGPVLIHAGLKDDSDGWEYLTDPRSAIDVSAMPEPVYGGVIGVVDIIDCVKDSPSPWARPGRWHYVLANPRPLPFTPARGKLGLFELATEGGE
jgi:ASCH domain